MCKDQDMELFQPARGKYLFDPVSYICRLRCGLVSLLIYICVLLKLAGPGMR
jgi:hypothetical protein